MTRRTSDAGEASDAGAPDTLDAQLARPRQTLVNQIWRWAACFAAIDLPIIGWRVSEVGWHPQLMVHTALCIMTLAVALAGARLSYALKAGLLVFGTISVGVAGVSSLGMVGTGYFWITVSSALVSVLYSLRRGVLLAMLTSAVLIAVGFGFTTGRLALPFDLNAHVVSASAWINFLAVTTVVPFVMLYAIGGFQHTVLDLLTRIQSQRDELLAQRNLLDQQRAQLEIQATHDTLTGLPVTRLAMQRLQAALDSATPRGARIALLYIDLDGFKAVNDTHGHDAGDLVLVEVARRLRAVTRSQDTVARVGGDEFIAILADVPAGEAATAALADLASQLIAEIALPISAGGVTVSVGASIGIAICPDHALGIDALRRVADAAMYRAKRRGKNRSCFAASNDPAH